MNLDTQRGFIERFLRGLSGRGMKVAAGDDAHTNTETVFLPRAIDRADTPAGNRLLYKAMATHLWAMNRFGTFRRPAPDAPTLRERLAAFEDAPGSTRLFYNLEAVRLDACIARELPGLAREIERVFPPRIGADLAQAAADLARPDATVEDTLRWTRELAAQRIDGAPLRPYQGYGDLEAAETLTAERLDEDRDALQRLIQDLIDQMQRGDLAPEGDENADIELDFDQDGPATQYRLMVGGKPLAVPVALRERIDSILQDLDSVPEDWITADGEPETRPPKANPVNSPSRRAATRCSSTTSGTTSAVTIARTGACCMNARYPATTPGSTGRPWPGITASPSTSGAPSRCCATPARPCGASPGARTSTSTPPSTPPPTTASDANCPIACSSRPTATSATSRSCSWSTCRAPPRAGSSTPSARRWCCCARRSRSSATATASTASPA
ncbi:MAG: hypothetical protein M5U09_10545 [Gammaproteobacteria bacterium]|nr:hypothetical protein [Gammaproteobacteria bacterium]